MHSKWFGRQFFRLFNEIHYPPTTNNQIQKFIKNFALQKENNNLTIISFVRFPALVAKLKSKSRK